MFAMIILLVKTSQDFSRAHAYNEGYSEDGISWTGNSNTLAHYCEITFANFEIVDYNECTLRTDNCHSNSFCEIMMALLIAHVTLDKWEMELIVLVC